MCITGHSEYKIEQWDLEPFGIFHSLTYLVENAGIDSPTNWLNVTEGDQNSHGIYVVAQAVLKLSLPSAIYWYWLWHWLLLAILQEMCPLKAWEKEYRPEGKYFN